MTSSVIESLVKNLKELILEALYTDGGHHKQWYLEQLLISITSPQEYAKILEGSENDEEAYPWEPGIVP